MAVVAWSAGTWVIACSSTALMIVMTSGLYDGMMGSPYGYPEPLVECFGPDRLMKRAKVTITAIGRIKA